MPQFENPYIDPVTVEHHASRHSVGGLDVLTPSMIGLADLDCVPVALGGTDATDGYSAFWNLAYEGLDPSSPGGGEPLYVEYGGTGVSTVEEFSTVLGLIFGSDARLTDARVPLAHAASHAMGGVDALAPADIGAALATHSHAGYLEATFDDATNHLTIGAKTFDLTSLLVP